ncbi:MAG TPA: hypothetical protein VKZ95_03460 [Sphingobacteriaceae bacterium]|nr:hypothetical protein [Sphingobacteriaceae bacterium]
MDIKDAVNFAAIEKLITVSEMEGNTFRPEDFYGTKIKVYQGYEHQELLTEFIQKYFSLKFIEKREETQSTQIGWHYIYELQPKS